MFDIRMVRHHTLPMAKARALAQKAAESFGARYDVQGEWQGDVLRFHYPGAEGEVRLSPSEIRIGVNLGLLLRPFKTRVVKRIEQHLDRLLERPAAKPARKR
jgi:putative polyhydroxyalkanoate system protein